MSLCVRKLKCHTHLVTDPVIHGLLVAITDPDAYYWNNLTAERLLELTAERLLKLASALLAARYVFFPACTNNCHWVLFVLDVGAWRLEAYDSKHDQHWREHTRIQRWIDQLLQQTQRRTDLIGQVCVDSCGQCACAPDVPRPMCCA